MIGDIVSFGAGTFMMAMSALVMKAYFPRFSYWSGRSDQYLVLAIFLGFLSVFLNGLYWSGLNHVLTAWDLATVEQLRSWGDWVDLFAKGGSGLAAWMHLKALHRQLPEQDRTTWTALEMPWYPSRSRIFDHIFGRR